MSLEKQGARVVIQHAPRCIGPLRRENRWLEQRLSCIMVPRCLLLPCRPTRRPLEIPSLEFCSSLPRLRGCVTIVLNARALPLTPWVTTLGFCQAALGLDMRRSHALSTCSVGRVTSVCVMGVCRVGCDSSGPCCGVWLGHLCTL